MLVRVFAGQVEHEHADVRREVVRRVQRVVLLLARSVPDVCSRTSTHFIRLAFDLHRLAVHGQCVGRQLPLLAGQSEATSCPARTAPPISVTRCYLDFPQAVSPTRMSFMSGSPNSSLSYSLWLFFVLSIAYFPDPDSNSCHTSDQININRMKFENPP